MDAPRGPLRTVSEAIARKTSRRSLFGRGAGVLFGMLAGTAAGVAVRGGAVAGGPTTCSFPAGRPCSCDMCLQNGVCAKPCVILTTFYASGCWAESGGTITCCDCSCPDQPQVPPSAAGWCGCGSDYHNNPEFCP
jgi:hypothetical protein